MNRRLLITGGLGYLGGRIAQGLAEDPDFEVIIATRRPRPVRPDWLPKGVLCHVPFDDSEAWVHACQGVTDVLHLASMNAAECERDPQAAMLINTIGTVRVLSAAEKAGVDRIAYMSSAHVYGEMSGDVTEQTTPRPRSAYAISKRSAEDFLLGAHEAKRIEAVVLRLSNGFGAPAHADIPSWSLLVNDLCRQAVLERSLRLRSSGVQVRDFIPMGDVVNAVRHVLHLPAKQIEERVYNLGGDHPISILGMAEAVASRCEVLLGFRPSIQRLDPKPGETPASFQYRCDKLKKTGFELQCPVELEIDRTLEFCRSLGTGLAAK